MKKKIKVAVKLANSNKQKFMKFSKDPSKVDVFTGFAGILEIKLYFIYLFDE